MSHGKFAGSITTVGTSEAIRLEKELFRAHPEFRQKAKVQASYIAHGKLLISVIDDGPKSSSEESDPLVDAFLGLIANDISNNPRRVKGLSKSIASRGSKLAKHVVVSDADVIPDDVTF